MQLQFAQNYNFVSSRQNIFSVERNIFFFQNIGLIYSLDLLAKNFKLTFMMIQRIRQDKTKKKS